MAEFVPGGQTNGLTPADFVTGPSMSPDAVGKVSVFCFAQDHSVGAAYWEWRALIRRIGSAEMTGVFALITHSNSPSAAAWVATPSFAGGIINVSCVGILGGTVDWLVTSDDPIIMAGAFS